MYSKIKTSGSFSSSDEYRESTCDRKQRAQDTSPSEIEPNNKSYRSKNSSNKKKVQIDKSHSNLKYSTEKDSREKTSTKAASYIKDKDNKKKSTKCKSVSRYTYETIVGIHLHRTSTLKFKKYIRAPRVKVSIYDETNCSLAAKSDVNRNVIINMEPVHVDYILPIMSGEGRLSDDRSFAFTFEECLIINEDIERIRDENIVIFFEILDTVVMNLKTRLKMKNLDGWHYISWAFFKPNSIDETHFNKHLILQLYKYRKSKRNANIFEHWSDSNRKKYPGTLEVTIKNVKYHQDKVETIRPHTALQKDKHISKFSAREQNILDDEGNFIFTSTSTGKDGGLSGCGLVDSRRKSDIVNTKAEKMSPLIKLQSFFRVRAKVECPAQELKCKQLAGRCLLCRFNEDGKLLAYTEEDVDEERIAEVGDNKVAITNIVIAQVPGLVQQYILKGHTDRIHCLRWMPAIRSAKLAVYKHVLLSASEDHTCILWYLGAEGNYSLEVLPHRCPIFGAEFLMSPTGLAHHNKSSSVLLIASGGSDTFLYIWQIDTITKKAKSKKSKKTTEKMSTKVSFYGDSNQPAFSKATRPRPRQHHEIHLQEEISKHDSQIVDVVYSRYSHNLYSGDVGGTVLEWRSQEEEVKNRGRSTGKILWTNTRSFRVADGLESLQIVDRTHNHSSSNLYASTVSRASTYREDMVVAVHKIDINSGHSSEIVSRALSSTQIKSMAFNFVVVADEVSTTCPSQLLYTSNANIITYLNMYSNTEVETIGIYDTRGETTAGPHMAAPIEIKESPFSCIKSMDITNNSTAGCEKNTLAIALTSNKQLEENYIFLYGSRNTQDSNAMDESTKSSQDAGVQYEEDVCAGGSRNTGNSSTTSDCKNISRLSSLLNEILNKCDRIIKYGSSNNCTFGYKLAANDNGPFEIDKDISGAESDEASVKSDRTFTIENLSMTSEDNSVNQCGNTLTADQNDEDISGASGNTFTLERKPKSCEKKVKKNCTNIAYAIE